MAKPALTVENPSSVEPHQLRHPRQNGPGSIKPNRTSLSALHLGWRLVRFIGLVAINAVLITPQLFLIIGCGMLGLDFFSPDKVVTWWPRRSDPSTDKTAI